jgi:putative Mg2+ transporter-C (MgtC) family protein
MEISTIGIRLLLIAVLAGVIGSEREFRSRPAGVRTHILVGTGATIIGLIQQGIVHEAISIAQLYPELSTVVRSDPARLIAQVVSGIGFLGAGTIIVQRRSIKGLTTAASLWATAGLGLATGMGYYAIACIGAFAILMTLLVLQHVIHINPIKKIEVKYIHRKETGPYIRSYFAENKIKVRDINMSVEIMDERRVYTNIYDVEIPRGVDDVAIIENLAKNKNITKIHMVSV